jgi:hypothetical protein
MTVLYSQVGGLRIGRSFWLSINASWPLATLQIYSDRLVLTGLFRRLSFPHSAIVRLSEYHGFLSSGIRIEHTVAAYPRLVIFWTRDLAALEEKLHANAFPRVTPAP